MRQFSSIEEVDTLTEDEALSIVQRQFELLVGLGQHAVVGLDDTGDYLAAAIDNYHDLFHLYWDNDGTGFREAVVEWLLTPAYDWGGTDGEVRFEVFTEAYVDASYKASEDDAVNP